MKDKEILLKRVSAYFVDIIIIATIIEILLSFNIIKLNYKKINSVEDSLVKLTENFKNDEVTIEEFRSEYISINYKLMKLENKVNIARLILYFSYFVVLEWKLGGQTLGKKLFKIKLTSTNENEPTFTTCFFRALIINNLFLYIMKVLGRYLLNDVSNYNLLFTISFLIEIFVLISAFTAIIRKDNKPLHDIIVKTEVIKCK